MQLAREPEKRMREQKIGVLVQFTKLQSVQHLASLIDAGAS